MPPKKCASDAGRGGYVLIILHVMSSEVQWTLEICLMPAQLETRILILLLDQVQPIYTYDCSLTEIIITKSLMKSRLQGIIKLAT
jgi:hypothetical protein